MNISTIRFGPKRNYSPLSPTQIQQEVQQITTRSKWFRNPFSIVKEQFEGEVNFSAYDPNYHTLA